MRIRTGDVTDVPALIALYDEAIAWMVARGNTEQWGSEPMSARPGTDEQVRRKVERGDLWIAEVDGAQAGALITSATPPDYVEPAAEPELYVNLLLTSRRLAGRGIGARLLDHARALATQRAVPLVRVDCHRGPDESLIRYYERNGFTRTRPFTVGEWPGQLLEQRLQP
jgi:GNAT superfamily N-acetyltransferase